jgi:hypothetical protein
MHGSCDLSVIVPFGDDEDTVGALVSRAAAHLAAQGTAFEIIAVDEGSGDNSVALLAYLRERMPALSIRAAEPGTGFAAGARVARGRTLLLWEPARAHAPLGPLAWARARVDGAVDVALVPGRYVAARRARAWRAVERARGRGATFERQLARQARRHGLLVAAPERPAAPLARFMSLLRLRA